MKTEVHGGLGFRNEHKTILRGSGAFDEEPGVLHGLLEDRLLGESPSVGGRDDVGCAGRSHEPEFYVNIV
mgnify:FL=1